CHPFRSGDPLPPHSGMTPPTVRPPVVPAGGPEPGAPGSAPPPGGRPAARAGTALAAYGGSRLLTVAVAALAGWRIGVGPVSVLSRWDAGWFLRVAQEGYPSHVPLAGGHVVESALAFFPLFPLLLKVLAALTPLSDALSGVIVSMAAGAAAAVLLYRIALRLTDDPDRAVRGVVLFSFFPGSMVLSMPYSEGVMVALAAACLLALLEERWWTAGLCAALATASRASALALVPACLWAAVSAARRHRRLGPLIAPALAPLGAVAFFGYLRLHTGDALAYLRAEKAWDSGLSFGRPALTMLGRFLRAPFSAPQPATATLALAFAAVTGVVLLRRRWPAVLSIYTFSVLAISVLTRTDGLRPRDVLTAFPLFLAAADVIEPRWMRLIVPASAAVLAVSLVSHNVGVWGQP
ncbi:MAG TPA: mannosyltransferase family protein, partial [Acidimicrobiia bacterium]|nr:mannosyltransferase family protein [Acidimicrobiia bacterium]